MISLRRLGLGLAFISGAIATTPLYAAESNGIIALPYEASNTLVIVDTNAKKILVYSVNASNGLSLKEVRSFEKALQAPNFFAPKGLNGITEKSELDKMKLEN